MGNMGIITLSKEMKKETIENIKTGLIIGETITLFGIALYIILKTIM